MWKYESLPIRFGVTNCSAARTTAAPSSARRIVRGPSAGADRSSLTDAARSVDQVADALPAHPAILAVPGPVDQERLALHVVERHEAPEAAVVAAVAVVAHDEDLVGRHGDRTVVVARGEPALVAGALDEVRPRVVDLLVVHVELLVLDLDDVTRLTDHPLDEVLLRIDRVDEDDDVAAPWVGELQHAFADQRNTDAVAEL